MLWSQELSLYSPQALSEKHHRNLLIQFLLFENIEAYKAMLACKWDAILTPHPRFFPYDWAITTGHINKIQEHGLLLKKSFPEKVRAVKNFENTLAKIFESLSKRKNLSKEQFELSIQKIYIALEPFIEACKENENLLFFLLKNRQTIDEWKGKGYLHRFILEIHPCGLETLGEKMCDQYHQRGFFSQIPEFKLLLTDLLHA